MVFSGWLIAEDAGRLSTINAELSTLGLGFDGGDRGRRGLLGKHREHFQFRIESVFPGRKISRGKAGGFEAFELGDLLRERIGNGERILRREAGVDDEVGQRDVGPMGSGIHWYLVVIG